MLYYYWDGVVGRWTTDKCLSWLDGSETTPSRPCCRSCVGSWLSRTTWSCRSLQREARSNLPRPPHVSGFTKIIIFSLLRLKDNTLDVKFCYFMKRSFSLPLYIFYLLKHSHHLYTFGKILRLNIVMLIQLCTCLFCLVLKWDKAI